MQLLEKIVQQSDEIEEKDLEKKLGCGIFQFSLGESST